MLARRQLLRIRVRLGGSRDHVLGEVAVAGHVDDGVVPHFREGLLRSAGNGHAAAHEADERVPCLNLVQDVWQEGLGVP